SGRQLQPGDRLRGHNAPHDHRGGPDDPAGGGGRGAGPAGLLPQRHVLHLPGQAGPGRGGPGGVRPGRRPDGRGLLPDLRVVPSGGPARDHCGRERAVAGLAGGATTTTATFSDPRVYSILYIL
ncbi:unnamed protein product, partial [Heterosigma akashiwo]